MPLPQGLYSYRNNHDYCRPVPGNTNLEMEIQPMDTNIARVIFRDTSADPPAFVGIPQEVALVDAISLAPCARVCQEFFIITWVASYTLTYNGRAAIEIYDQKRQAIQPVPNDA